MKRKSWVELSKRNEMKRKHYEKKLKKLEKNEMKRNKDKTIAME